jgi:DNA-binding NarL/FixJ family response regulator
MSETRRRATDVGRRSGEHTRPPLHIVLADDHPVLRRGLRSLIEERPWMRVVGEASDGLTACHLVEELRPDVLVIDFTMPGLDGAQATARCLESHPTLRVVALSVHEDGAHVSRFLAAGASGYVIKRTAADELIHAIQVVAKGGLYIDPALADHVVGGYLGRPMADGGPDVPLSARELEVLRLTVRGHGNKTIAARLGVSVRTVETYRERLMTKLQLRGRDELVRYAIEHGLLDAT